MRLVLFLVEVGWSEKHRVQLSNPLWSTCPVQLSCPKTCKVTTINCNFLDIGSHAIAVAATACAARVGHQGAHVVFVRLSAYGAGCPLVCHGDWQSIDCMVGKHLLLEATMLIQPPGALTAIRYGWFIMERVWCCRPVKSISLCQLVPLFVSRRCWVTRLIQLEYDLPVIWLFSPHSIWTNRQRLPFGHICRKCAPLSRLCQLLYYYCALNLKQQCTCDSSRLQSPLVYKESFSASGRTARTEGTPYL